MPYMIQIAIFGWVPFSLLLFLSLPVRQAVLTCYVLGWLTLPTVTFDLPGLPDYTKASAVSYSVLIGTFAFTNRYLPRFRPRWFDLPIAIYVLCSVPSSLANDLGIYDGLSASLTRFLSVGVPYFMGRIYVCDDADLKAFAKAFFVGGLCYVPPCLFEIRMSPQIARYIYGLGGFLGSQMRFGGYRPAVLLSSGLELGMWMTAATLMGWALWRHRCIQRVFGMTCDVALGVLFVVTLLCRSSGALFLLLLGAFTIWVCERTRTSLVFLLLLVTPAAFIGTRSTGAWKGTELCDWLARNFDAERAESLLFRFVNEDMYIKRAWERPAFGWGGFNRHQVVDEAGRYVTINDSQWIIIFGTLGYLGTISWLVTMSLPAILFLVHHRVATWKDPAVSTCAAFAVLVALHTVDCLVNAQYNPLFLLGLGAVASFAMSTSRSSGASGAGPALVDVRWSTDDGQDADGQPLTEEEHRRAVGVLEAAWAHEPTSPALTHDLAAAYEEFARYLVDQGRLEDAERLWGLAIERLDELVATSQEDPGHVLRAAMCRNDLAWALANGPASTEATRQRALLWAQAATQLAPHEPIVWNTLAAIQYRLGSWRECVRLLEQAGRAGLNCDGHNDFLLAMAYLRSGDPQSARLWFDRGDRFISNLPAVSRGLQSVRDEAHQLLLQGR